MKIKATVNRHDRDMVEIYSDGSPKYMLGAFHIDNLDTEIAVPLRSINSGEEVDLELLVVYD